jgi:hypothetical protein
MVAMTAFAMHSRAHSVAERMPAPAAFFRLSNDRRVRTSEYDHILWTLSWINFVEQREEDL